MSWEEGEGTHTHGVGGTALSWPSPTGPQACFAHRGIFSAAVDFAIGQIFFGTVLLPRSSVLPDTVRAQDSGTPWGYSQGQGPGSRLCWRRCSSGPLSTVSK